MPLHPPRAAILSILGALFLLPLPSAEAQNLRDLVSLRRSGSIADIDEPFLLLGLDEVDEGVDLNGDGDQGDRRVAHLLDLVTGRLTNLGLATGSMSISGKFLLLSVSETGQQTDLNGDGQIDDTVAHVYRHDTREVTNLEIDCHNAQSSPRLAAFTAVESSQGNTDLNGDGDNDDNRVLFVHDFATGETRNLGLALGVAHVEGPIVACTVDEFAQGQDLNGDGDDRDFVVFVYDARTGEVSNTGLAFTTQSPFQRQRFIVGDQIYVPVGEFDQGFTDLNGDGDRIDVVIHVYNVVTGRSRSLGLAGFSWVEGRFVIILAYEFDNQVTDLNGDGDPLDWVVHVLDPLGPTLHNLALAGQTNNIFPRSGSTGDHVFFLVNEADQNGRDLNGNGTAGSREENVVFGFDVATGRITNLAMTTDLPQSAPGLSSVGNRLFLYPQENVERRDLNGDGDLSDYLVRVHDVESGVTVEMDIAQSFSYSEHVIALAIDEEAAGRDLNGDGDAVDDDVIHVSIVQEPFGEGNVNLGTGTVAPVLRINGLTGTVNVPSDTALELSLDAAPMGGHGRYVLWAWMGRPKQWARFTVGPASLGYLVDPAPPQAQLGFGPFACLAAPGLPDLACRLVPTRVIGPPAVPFTLSLPNGLADNLDITLQGLIEDAGAANPLGWSITNAVIVHSR